MEDSGIQIRPMRPEDARAVTRLHVAVFPGFFLSFLGERFLFEFYRAVCENPRGIARLALREDVLVGFVAGAVEPAGFYGELLRRRWWRFALAAVGPALRRPSIARRLLRALRAPGEAGRSEERATLLSIGVAAEGQGMGTGRRLVDAFLEAARGRAARVVDLVTDAEGNEAVNRFYRGLGLVQVASFVTPEGRAMNRYEIELERVHG